MAVDAGGSILQLAEERLLGQGDSRKAASK